jgi:pentatricopeptide repeat protein
MEHGVRIRILGPPDVTDLPADLVFPNKAYQLLALLLRSSQKRLSRKTMASLLWESKSDPAALANLRQLLVRIRKILPDHKALFVTDAQTVGLGGEASHIDLWQFDAAPQQDGNLALFRGDLLEGIDDATDAFTHWLVRERAALREQFFAAAASKLMELTRYGRAEESQLRAIAERMLALDPEREATYRILIEAYGRNGMTEEAERAYRTAVEMLRREHDTGPSPETLGVARRVLSRREAAQIEPPQRLALPRPRIAFLAPAWQGDALSGHLFLALIEDIANELARYRSFIALAPHSSFQVAHDSGLPLDNAALRADYTVSGFVKSWSHHPLLSLRMVSCASSEIVWTGEFPLDGDSLTKSFDHISARVAINLAEGLDRNLLENLRKGGENGAYLRYLEGQQWLKNCDLSRLRRARKAFADALSSDSRFAPARARIGQTLYLEWLLLGGTDPKLLLDAKHQADLTLELDPNNALGHWISGVVALYQRDFDLSARRFNDAEILSPNSADLLVQHADALAHFGKADEGWRKFERAIDLNPLPPDHYWWAGASVAFVQKDLTKAIDLCARLKNDEPVLRLLAASHGLMGNIDVAQRFGRRLRELYPEQSAEQMFKIAPDRSPEVLERFLAGLKLAGVK